MEAILSKSFPILLPLLIVYKMFYEISSQWIVVKEPLKIGKKQIEAFRSLKDRSGQNLGEK